MYVKFKEQINLQSIDHHGELLHKISHIDAIILAGRLEGRKAKLCG